MHLVFNDISGSTISATLRTRFTDGNYDSSNYTGTLSGDDFSLTLTDSDPHPLPDQIEVSDDGGMYSVTYKIVGDHKVSGTFFDDARSVKCGRHIFHRC